MHVIAFKLTSSSLQIIKNWETSGTEFGQVVHSEDDEDYGHYDPSRNAEGDNR
jgi:hypothetical protein